MKAGRLVYVVGPSGAGKDSVLGWVMDHADAGLGLHLARRSVSRVGNDATEVDEPLNPEQFAGLDGEGAFTMRWLANGLWYGVRHTELAPLKAGRCVLINGSRGWLEEARNRFPDLIVAQITASPDVLRQRLQQRGRETPEQIAARLVRALQLQLAASDVDMHIVNNTTIDAAGQSFLRLLART